MHMWPIEQPPPLKHPRKPVHPPVFGERGPPAWTQAPGSGPGPPTHPPGHLPPGPPTRPPGHLPSGPPPPPMFDMKETATAQDPQTVNSLQQVNLPSKRPKKKAGTLPWFFGGRPKRDKKSRAQPIIPVAAVEGQLETPIAPSVTTSTLSTASEVVLTDDETDHSDSSSDAELSIRREALSRNLIVVYKPRNLSNSRLRTIRRQNTTSLDMTPGKPRLLDIGSARVYWEGPGTLHSASLELIRQQVPTPSPTGVSMKKDEVDQMTWL